MGLILDSSVVVAAERRGLTVADFLDHVVNAAGDQEAALSAVGATELIHGIYRAATPESKARRQTFVAELLADLAVHPYTLSAAVLAGRMDGNSVPAASPCPWWISSSVPPPCLLALPS